MNINHNQNLFYCYWPAILFLAVLALFFGRASASEEQISPESNTSTDSFSDFADLDLSLLLNAEVDLGSGVKQRLSDLPAIVEVFTADDIRRLGIRDLRELLLFLPGGYEYGDAAAPIITPSLRIRGGPTASRIMLIVEDHNQLDDINELFEMYSVPIEAIDRVEYLRGPAATLYGSSAMAGVVRVILKKQKQPGAGGTVAYDPWGKGGELSLHGGYASSKNPFSLRADAQVRRTENRRWYQDSDSHGKSGSYSHQADYVAGLFTVAYKTVYARGRYHIHQGDFPGFEGTFDSDASESTRTYYGVELGHKQTWSSGWSLANAAAIDIRNRDIDLGIFPTVLLGTRANLEDQRTHLLFDGTLISVKTSANLVKQKYSIVSSVEYRNINMNRFRFRFRSDGTLHPLSPPPNLAAQLHDMNLALQGSYSIIEALDVLGGFRLNVYKPKGENTGVANETPDATISPMGRAAVVVHATDSLSFKAMYGRAFRLPTLQEMFIDLAGVVNATPELGPEIQDTIELAMDARVIETLSLRVNGFYNWIRDSIDFYFLYPGINNQVKYRNAPEGDVINTRGGELTLRWIPSRLVDTAGSFTFHEGQYGDGSYLRQLPRVLSKVWLTVMPFKNNRLELTPSLIYIGAMGNSAGDLVSNFAGNYKPLDWLTVSLNIINIGNAKPGVYHIPLPPGSFASERNQYLHNWRAARLGVTAEF